MFARGRHSTLARVRDQQTFREAGTQNLRSQKQKRALGPSRGFKHCDHLTDYQLTDYIIYNLFPNSVITVGPDGVQLLRPRPHAADPTKCLFDHWWLVPQIEGRTKTPLCHQERRVQRFHEVLNEFLAKKT